MGYTNIHNPEIFQYTHFLLPPTRCQKKFYRRRDKAIDVKLFRHILGREDQSFREAPPKERLPKGLYTQKKHF